MGSLIFISSRSNRYMRTYHLNVPILSSHWYISIEVVFNSSSSGGYETSRRHSKGNSIRARFNWIGNIANKEYWLRRRQTLSPLLPLPLPLPWQNEDRLFLNKIAATITTTIRNSNKTLLEIESRLDASLCFSNLLETFFYVCVCENARFTINAWQMKNGSNTAGEKQKKPEREIK